MAIDAETTKYILALDEEIQLLWQTFERHSTAEEFRRSAQEHQDKAEAIRKQVSEYRSELATHVKSLSEETARYVNIVSVIGYAGFFATWGFTKDILGKETAAFVGLMGMISVSLFVLWEMFGIFLRLKAVGAIGRIFQSGVSVEHFEELRLELVSNEARQIAIANPAHRIVFLASFLSIVAGGMVMMQKLYMSL